MATACGSVASSTTPDAAAGDAADAGPGDTAAPRTCDPSAKFAAPVPITQLAMAGVFEYPPRLSTDERTIYFTGKATADSNLFAAQRASLTEPFGAPALLSMANSTADDQYASISADDLVLAFESNRTANAGYHLYLASRATAAAEFASSTLATVNASDISKNDVQPFLTADGKELWFASTRDGGAGDFDIWRAPRTGNQFGAAVAVSELNSATVEWLPTLSADRLTVYFASDRAVAGVSGGQDIWRARRSTVDDGFGTPTPVAELNSSADDLPGWLSADNCRLYLGSNILGNGNIYVATRQP
jgi:hypothetical protein